MSDNACVPTGSERSIMKRHATLAARPEAIQLDLAKTAVLVIDMQNDFGAKGGMFDRAGIDISLITRAVEPTKKVIAAARQAGVPIVYLKMAFKPDLSDAGPSESPNHARHMRLGVGSPVMAPDGSPSRILIRDTWSTDVLEELAPEADDLVIYKHRFSGFYETALDTLLSERGVRQLVVTGCTTSICVESTIRDAMFRDYACVLLEDCTGEPIGSQFSRSNHDASLLAIEVLLGWISSSDEFLHSVGAASVVPATK